MDCRFHFKGTFQVYGGRTYTADMSCNWSAEPGEIDERIKDFFLNAYDESYWQYEQRMDSFRREDEQKRLEAHERAELARLKEKYENTCQNEKTFLDSQ